MTRLTTFLMNLSNKILQFLKRKDSTTFCAYAKEGADVLQQFTQSNRDAYSAGRDIITSGSQSSWWEKNEAAKSILTEIEKFFSAPLE